MALYILLTQIKVRLHRKVYRRFIFKTSKEGFHPSQAKSWLEAAVGRESSGWLRPALDDCGEFPCRPVIPPGFSGSLCGGLSCLSHMRIRFQLFSSSAKWNEMENFAQAWNIITDIAIMWTFSHKCTDDLAVWRIHSTHTPNQPSRLSFKAPFFYSEFLLMILHTGDICGRPTVCLWPQASEMRRTNPCCWGYISHPAQPQALLRLGQPAYTSP